ncbi:hypothetical protein D9611_007463 [Ephemerocybe angulata]|uniref:Uncharacterized protein n=1 Tax=Ephemerocybe angulata TaxID=980116 RepID=A0A8H5FLB9_9AGAR|nr:hypothetical protein D9611_007463 [Tulosesus angulatus]
MASGHHSSSNATGCQDISVPASTDRYSYRSATSTGLSSFGLSTSILLRANKGNSARIVINPSHKSFYLSLTMLDEERLEVPDSSTLDSANDEVAPSTEEPQKSPLVLTEAMLEAYWEERKKKGRELRAQVLIRDSPNPNNKEFWARHDRERAQLKNDKLEHHGGQGAGGHPFTSTSDAEPAQGNEVPKEKPSQLESLKYNLWRASVLRGWEAMQREPAAADRMRRAWMHLSMRETTI